MWVPMYGTIIILKNQIQIIFKAIFFPLPRTKYQSYIPSNDFPHLKSTNYLSTDCMSWILLHHPRIPHPKNIKLSHNESKTILMLPFFYLALLTKSVAPWSMIRISTGPSNLGTYKIIQPSIFSTSTRIHILWLSTSTNKSLKKNKNAAVYRVTSHISHFTYIH